MKIYIVFNTDYDSGSEFIDSIWSEEVNAVKRQIAIYNNAPNHSSPRYDCYFIEDLTI